MTQLGTSGERPVKLNNVCFDAIRFLWAYPLNLIVELSFVEHTASATDTLPVVSNIYHAPSKANSSTRPYKCINKYVIVTSNYKDKKDT